MRKIELVIEKICFIVSIVSLIAFFGIMAITVIDVIIRYATGVSILGVYEIVERTMLCGVFASFAYTQMQRGHIEINLIINMFPNRLRYAVEAFGYILGVGISVLVAFAAYRQGITALTSNYTTGVLYIPLHPFYWLECVCMIIFAIAQLYFVVDYIYAVFSKKEAEYVEMEEKGGTQSAL